MAIIDISRTLCPQMAVWPGDRPFDRSWTARLEEGSSVNLGAVSLSLHAGSHADAPLHFDADGASVTQLDLDSFLGPASVIDVRGVEAIRPEHLQGAVPIEPRVLFRTSFSEVPIDEWRDDFPFILPKTIDWLGARGVVLVGMDTPSVDPADSTALSAHHALHRNGIVNIEHLNLRGVAAGTYHLVALPLKLEGMDASPVRAVLIDEM